VAHTSEYKLDPCLGLLSAKWATTLGSTILKVVGITERFSTEVLTHQLQILQNEDPSAYSQSLAVKLACEVAYTLKEKVNKNMKLVVPTVSGRMLPVSQVSINDAPWVGSGNVEMLDDNISVKFGRTLGATSVRDKLAQMCEADKDPGDHFGQHEDLKARLCSILEQYNEVHDIFNEHLQNCDDAGAEEVTFAFDARSHAIDQLVDDRAKILQGPALLFMSSKSLNTEDIKLIQRLGDSIKRSDFSKCGR